MAPEQPDASIAVAVAPLELPGVTDVEYELSVTTPAATVWSKTLRSTQFGDGAGALSYVGPCDGEYATNTVNLRVLRVEGPGGAALSFVDPGLLSREAACTPMEDTKVTFDISLMRPAEQGFFDIGVSFDDIFCSAKVDCRDAFLHDPADGERKETIIVALACTAGGAGEATWLYHDALTLSCYDAGGGLVSETVVDPSQGPGNTGQSGVHVYQVATYIGAEELAPYEKIYWNTAIGVDTVSLGAAGVDCSLTGQMAAGDALWDGGDTPEGAVTPYIDVNVTVAEGGAMTCGETPLLPDGNGVDPDYVAPPETRSFRYFMHSVSCVDGHCDLDSFGLRCSGTYPGVADEVVFEDTPDGVIVTHGTTPSAAMPLPAGHTLAGCCADPCCDGQ